MRASEMDDRIESSAKNSYVFKTVLKNDSIKPVSKDGAVVISGTVSEASHKLLAQDTIENLPGVVSVDNQLTVDAGTASELSDGWLMMKVETMLMFHRHVSSSDTKVTVTNGNVTLSGVASSAASRELASQYAMDVDGVKTVKNDMTVSMAPDKDKQSASEILDDASITAQIKYVLLAHRSTSALKTTVKTMDGVVIVSGIAQNEAEKALVSKLVNDVRGVNKVVNNMTVEIPAKSSK
ncbi:MAG: BON domain-containing protein [Opitutales bacterium]